MDVRVTTGGIEYSQVLIRGDSRNIFEYEHNAFDLAEKENGEVVEVYYCSIVNLAFASVEEDGKFAGYGVLVYDDWNDPKLL